MSEHAGSLTATHYAGEDRASERKGPMTRTTCPTCRLRFNAMAAAASCPFCGGSLAVLTAEQSLGYRLAGPDASSADLPVARAAALPVPGPDGGRRV
jgi:hypothetical protein